MVYNAWCLVIDLEVPNIGNADFFFIYSSFCFLVF